MLAGKRAFEGESVAETLAAVLRGEPDWTALPRQTPSSIVVLIKQLLVKDRRQRIGDIAAAIFVLSHPLQDTRGASAAAGSRKWAALAAAFLAGSAIVAGLAWWLARESVTTEPELVTRFEINLGGADVFGAFNSRLLDLSPDGRHLVYVANRRLNLRSLDRLESVPIRGTESNLPTDPPPTINPTFSPDGRWIGFWHMGQLKKIALEGGAHVAIAPAADVTAFHWEADGTLLFAGGGAIWTVPETGGTPEKVLDGVNGRVQSVQWLPGKRAILYTLFPPGSIATTEVTVHELESGEKRTLSTTGIEARYVPTGHIAFWDAGALMAVPFDVATLTSRGSARPMAENVASSVQPGRANTAAHFAISRSGTLAYMNGAVGDSGVRTLVWVDRNGHEEPVAGIEPRPYVYPRLSPDGRRIALTDFSLRALRRFSHSPDNERYAVWTPDGNRILFGSNRNNRAATWWQAADGSGDAELLAEAPTRRFNNLVPTTIAPDGSRAVLTATGPTTEGGTADLWLVTMTGERRVEPLLATPATERNAEISPDGRWIAYEAVDRDQPDIWVRSFPDVNRARWQVTTGGASQPAWAPNGKELFYRDLSGVLMSVPVQSEASFEYGAPAKVVAAAYVNSVATYAGRLYDVSPDGKRFLMMKAAGVPDQRTEVPRITVVENWFEELRRTMPR
jgi:serine/threonine-protein kinase